MGFDGFVGGLLKKLAPAVPNLLVEVEWVLWFQVVGMVVEEPSFCASIWSAKRQIAVESEGVHLENRGLAPGRSF